MAITTGTAPAGAVPPAPARPVPARAAGLQLIGEMRGSGYRNPPALVRRADGQTLQLTPLLYQVLAAVDGERDEAAIASHVAVETGRAIAPEDVHHLIEEKLRPLGVLLAADGSTPQVRKGNPLLALRFRWVVSNPAVTRRITAPFAALFWPPVLIAAVIAFVLVVKWVLFDHGLAFAASEAFRRPGLLLLVFAVTLVSAGFHEFGHASAARYGGATPGVMGAGLYLVWPAFYTDVTDTYRLGRGGRLRTDLGGLYFNALVCDAVFAVWWATGWDALLLIIATQLIQMLRQLPPMVRFDGYHIVADLTGVPDLFHRIKPTLLGLWPGNWRKPETRALKPWARAVVTLWVVVIVPLMLFALLLTIVSLPRIVATAAQSFQVHGDAMLSAFGAGDVVTGLAKLLDCIAVAIPVFGVAYILVRLGRRIWHRTWAATRGRPVRRALAMVTAVAVIAALAFAWWPRGNYEPIQPYERGTVQDAIPTALESTGQGLSAGQSGNQQVMWLSDSQSLPTAAHPALALVLRPRDGAGPTWVFPFNKPLPPGAGDNQALAVNTRNGTVVYDAAFALVWAGSGAVLNKNEAYAFASCRGCGAVAIAFQIVLVLPQSHVVVPQNLSGSVTYHCIACFADALAVQLVVTVDHPLTAAQRAALEAVWRRVLAFGSHLIGLSFAQIQQALAGYQRQIVAIVHAPAATSTSGASPATSPSGVPTSVAGTSPAASSSTGSSASGSSSSAPPSSSGSPSGTGTSAPPSSSPPATSTSPTPTPSPTPSGTG